MKDGQIEMVSMISTAVITAGLFVPVLFFTEAAEAQRPDMSDMDAIEATIAYKTAPVKQPQKKMKEPDPVEKPEGVSHDENKPVNGCKSDADCKHAGETCDVKANRCIAKKPDKPPKKDDPVDPLAKFKHPQDDDDQTGKPTTQPGDFNGNEFGWAPQTKGDPYWQSLAKDIHENFALPTISDTNGIPVGCFHITADGKIADTKMKEHSQSPDLDRAATDAIDAVAKLRNANPNPVPTQLLGAITRWICFRFDPNKV